MAADNYTENVLQNETFYKLGLVQIVAWLLKKVTSHDLNQYWLSILTPICVNLPRLL